MARVIAPQRDDEDVQSGERRDPFGARPDFESEKIESTLRVLIEEKMPRLQRLVRRRGSRQLTARKGEQLLSREEDILADVVRGDITRLVEASKPERREAVGRARGVLLSFVEASSERRHWRRIRSVFEKACARMSARTGPVSSAICSRSS